MFPRIGGGHRLGRPDECGSAFGTTCKTSFAPGPLLAYALFTHLLFARKRLFSTQGSKAFAPLESNPDGGLSILIVLHRTRKDLRFRLGGFIAAIFDMSGLEFASIAEFFYSVSRTRASLTKIWELTQQDCALPP